MSHQINRYLIFVYIGFFVIVDVLALTKLFQFGHELPRDWGIMGRLVLPSIFYIVSYKAEGKNKRLALCFFATARLVYFNSIMLSYNLKLAATAILVAFLLDILAFYTAIMSFRQFPVDERISIANPRILVITLCASILIVVLFFYFIGQIVG
jgi:hypothetical protein